MFKLQQEKFKTIQQYLMINKINMETLRRKISEDITSPLIESNKLAEKQLAEYQKNMKIFIQAVEKQMAAIIDKYENQIKELKNQIQSLKKQLNFKGVASTGFDFAPGIESQLSQCISPIKHKGAKSLLGGETIRSNFFEQLPIKNFFQADPTNFFSLTQSKTPQFSNGFQVKNSPDRLSKSRFQLQSKRKRQRQEDLLHFLEMGKSNLQQNTGKMFGLIGKSSQYSKREEQNQQQIQEQLTVKKKKDNQGHNSSLNSICDSLNNSFHGKKAQQKNAKKRRQQESKQMQEKRKEQQRQKFKKQQGIKNLLTTMRKNISHSLDKPQIIKGSKLLTTGQKGKSIQTSSKVKVMINPVPVDLSQMNKQKQHNSMTTSPSKNPQSILKNSSNVLTKSIENISAISFYSSGGQQ